MKISLQDMHHIMEACASGLPQFFDSGGSKVYVKDLAKQAKKVADAASSIASANKKKKAKGASSGDAASEV